MAGIAETFIMAVQATLTALFLDLLFVSFDPLRRKQTGFTLTKSLMTGPAGVRRNLAIVAGEAHAHCRNVPTHLISAMGDP